MPIAMRQLGVGRGAGLRRMALALALLLAPGAGAAMADDLEILVLSNRADLVSAGDAFVEVVVPPDVNPATVRVSRNRTDITSAFIVPTSGP